MSDSTLSKTTPTPEYRTALITGASSGIGREMALWFAKRGTTVYAAARRADRLEALAKETNGKVVPFTLDVCNQQEVVDRIQSLDTECNGLDLIIANAGVGGPTPAERSNWTHVESVLQVNVFGTAATLTAVLPRMVERNRGHVVGVGSIASYRGMGGYSAYSGSKAFVSTFMESLRVDLRNTQVQVTCIEPGFVKSEMSAKLEGKVPMPFILDTHVAADKIGRAILRGTDNFAFPWAHAWPAWMMKAVPNSIFDYFASRAPRLEL